MTTLPPFTPDVPADIKTLPASALEDPPDFNDMEPPGDTVVSGTLTEIDPDTPVDPFPLDRSRFPPIAPSPATADTSPPLFVAEAPPPIFTPPTAPEWVSPLLRDTSPEGPLEADPELRFTLPV